MIDIRTLSIDVLAEAGFTSQPISSHGCDVLLFEDITVLGFLFVYPDPRQLIDSWTKDVNRVITGHQFGLRRAGQKSWNTYVVLLAVGDADHSDSVALASIEEDLVGTRKIARAGVRDLASLRAKRPKT
jgi:hypothetical protein